MLFNHGFPALDEELQSHDNTWWVFAYLRMFVVCLMAPGTRGEGGGERHDRHERKDGCTLNTSWITNKRSQSFFISWKSAYKQSFSNGGTFLLASARKNKLVDALPVVRKSQGELWQLTFRNFKKPINKFIQ
jgi:hypothetical protein